MIIAKRFMYIIVFFFVFLGFSFIVVNGMRSVKIVDFTGEQKTEINIEDEGKGMIILKQI